MNAALIRPAAAASDDLGTLWDLWSRALQRFPERVALVDAQETLTYRALETRIRGFAAAFAARGLGPGSAIAQLADNRADAVAVLGAALALGIRYTPLHPRGSSDDHVFIVGDAEIDLVVVDEISFGDRIETLSAAAPVATFDELRWQGEPPRLVPVAGEIAAIFYTGGTTGRPKGVVHRNASLVMNTLLELGEFEWPDELRFLAATPISHAAFAFLTPVFHRGGSIVLQAGFSAASFYETVARHRITATFLVPAMLTSLLQAPRPPREAIASLGMIVYGAAPIAPERLRDLLGYFGPVFVQLYGQTEAPNVITVLRRDDHDPDRPDRLLSCGVPLAGLDVRLLDDDCNEVPAGAVGEICVRGRLVMDGYWKRPRETEEVFAGGWLHTGDMAVADAEGYLTIVDRKKDLIISGGFNVFPREVEDVLTSHPAVLLACVIGVPSPKWGEEVTAIVVCKQGASVEADLLRELVKSRKGAVYAPKTVLFETEIPLTPLGKPDKKALRDRFWGAAVRRVN